MEDLFKKVMYTGVGLVTTAGEKIQKNIDELVKKGSLSEEEGRKVVNELWENTEAKKDEFEGKLKDCLLYTSPSPRDLSTSRMPSSA